MHRLDASAWLAGQTATLDTEITDSDWALVAQYERDLRDLLTRQRRDDSGVLTNPLGVKRALATQGYGGIDLPTRYAGRGRSSLVQMMTQFVSGYYDTDLRDAAHVGHGRMLLSHASRPATRRWLDRALRGDLIGVAVTERVGGSNLARLSTVAEPDGPRRWRLCGEKRWVSRIEESSAFIVFFRIEGRRGLSTAVVDCDRPGWRREPRIPSGLGAWSWGTLGLDGVPINEEDFLSSGSNGRAMFEQHFDYYRPMVAATALGAAAGVYDEVAEAVAGRVREGTIERPRDAALEKLGRAFVELQAALGTALNASQQVTRRASDARIWSRAAKGHSVETALNIAEKLSVLVGAASFQRSSFLAKAQRDLRGLCFADGIHDALFQSAGRRLLEVKTRPAAAVLRDIS